MIEIFNKPCVVAVIGNTHSGKSNLIYYLIKKLQKHYNFNLKTFGLKYNVGKKINSLEELEKIKDSLIVLDEFKELFDLEDRRKRKQIERTIRLIFHNNNILLLGGLPENFKKFISNKINYIFYKKVTFGDFINGSRVKQIALNYCGDEAGSTLLSLNKDETLLFNGSYKKFKVPYLANFDSKKNNSPIFVPQNIQ